MAKQDVLDAINATIVPNGTKAINADSLRNLLTMMVENAGEGGSGDGALRVIVPEMMFFGPAVLDMGELTPTSWATLKSELEAEGLDLSIYDAVVNASFAHNATVAQQILEKGKAGQGVLVVLDQTPYSQAYIDIQSQMAPEMATMVESFVAGAVQPAGHFLNYMKPTPEGEPILLGESFECYLVPLGHISTGGMEATYPSNMQIILSLDGSLFFEVIESETESGS